MTARRRSGGGFHRFISAVRRFVEAIKHARDGGQQGGGRTAGGPGGRNRQEQCPSCHRFVAALCTDAEEGAEPCFFGVDCCCTGPHRAPRGSQQQAAE